MSEDHRRIVASGYDRVAGSYLATKDAADPATLDALEEPTRDLPPGAAILDLGCGAGIPATRWLSERGFSVTGVDFSTEQIKLARQNVPAAAFVRADMTELDFAPGSFDAVVALHSIIHIPREEHATMLAKIHHWLKPGGRFLATLSITAWEGEDPNWEGWGAPMRWSHHDRATNETLLKEAGFKLLITEPRTGGGTGAADETWLWILARKPT